MLLLSDIFIATIMRSIIQNWITLITISLFFSACEKESVDSSSIMGKWELTNHSIISNGQLSYNFDYQRGSSYIYHFKVDKTFTLSSVDSILYHGTYTLDSTRFSIHSFVAPGVETYGVFNCMTSNTTLTLFNSGRDIAGEFTETHIYTRLSHR